jgi:hypothetical protein
METNVEDVYLAGVICGGKTHKWFIIENSPCDDDYSRHFRKTKARFSKNHS